MDIHGGKGICLGPSNYLGRSYQHIPVSITVEGANILTRNMIIFGQGAIRCHPYLLSEIRAASDSDTERGLAQFDKALIGHVAFTLGNAGRAFWHGITGASLAAAPGGADPETLRYFSILTRFTAAFAFLADISLLTLGGSMKRKERLSARLGDILSLLYLASAVLKRFKDDRRPPADLPLMHWSMQDTLYRTQEAFYGVLDNFPGRVLGPTLRVILFPWGKPLSPPSDELEHKVARLMLAPGESRDRLTAGIYLPASADEPLGTLEEALQCSVACEAVEARLRMAVKSGQIPAGDDERIEAGLKQRIITSSE